MLIPNGVSETTKIVSGVIYEALKQISTNWSWQPIAEEGDHLVQVWSLTSADTWLQVTLTVTTSDTPCMNVYLRSPMGGYPCADRDYSFFRALDKDKMKILSNDVLESVRSTWYSMKTEDNANRLIHAMEKYIESLRSMQKEITDQPCSLDAIKRQALNSTHFKSVMNTMLLLYVSDLASMREETRGMDFKLG